MNRIIFLDVDGVLNNGTWAAEMYDRGVHVFRDGLLYRPSLVQLRRILDQTGALIVVSSSWRLEEEASAILREWLELYGMSIFDETPYLDGERGDEITAWFDRHPGDWRYVILDDDDDMGIHLDHLVRTSFQKGLTALEADRCIEMLNK